MKRVDTAAETRIVVVDIWDDTCIIMIHGDVLSVGDLQCVLDFLVLYIYN